MVITLEQVYETCIELKFHGKHSMNLDQYDFILP